ncbi:MAG: helix-turn-helix domain-containing protein [Armatimonadetes bacterium]|nr:helix-turn-helix domain-containing protein [Armatimonadota bacterium]
MDLVTSDGRKELGRRIQAAIMEAGYGSLSEFARQVGWSRALIYQYVNGTVLVQLDRLQQIAERTGKTLEWFLVGDQAVDNGLVAELREALGTAREEVRALQLELSEERAARLSEGQRQLRSELNLLGDYCRALRRAGDAPGLVEAGSRWLEAAQRAGDQRSQMQARLQMGHGWFLQGQLGRAEEVLAEAVTEAGGAGQEAIVNSARQELVRVLLQSGKTDEARRQASSLAHADLWWPRWAGRLMLAAIAAQEAELDECTEELQQAEEVIESGDEPAARRAVARAYLLSNRVTAALAAGQYGRAASLNDELRSLAAQAGVADQLREAELNRAIIAVRRGQVADAQRSLGLLRDWAQMAQDARLEALTSAFQSELARRLGQPAEARELGRAALQKALGSGQPHLMLEAHLALAHAELADGRTDDARYHVAQAQRLAGELRHRRLELEAELLSLRVASGEQASVRAMETKLLATLEKTGILDLHAEGMLLHARGQAHDDRLALLQSAAARALDSGHFWGAEAALRALAETYLSAGDHAAARETIATGCRLIENTIGTAECCPTIEAGWRQLRERVGISPGREGASQ